MIKYNLRNELCESLITSYLNDYQIIDDPYTNQTTKNLYQII